MNVLVVNAGSSSLKIRLLDPADHVIETRDLPAPRGEHDRARARKELTSLAGIDAVGHRIVHGGSRFREPVLVDARVRRQLRELIDLAPLHQPKSLDALDTVAAALPDVPAVACFDTAFHAQMPAGASTYALPAEWRKRWGIRRFGFHGLSHDYVSRRAAQIVGKPRAELRIVTCHLGAGASLAAVNGDHSVDTTMGFTPLEGLVMATRSGTVDPGLVLWLREHANMPSRELAETLEHRSGLLGLAGTPDMRLILNRRAAGDTAAALAVEVYLHRLCAGVAAMTAALGGLDVLAFAGGVGENSPEIRRMAAERLGFLGVALDDERNEFGPGGGQANMAAAGEEPGEGPAVLGHGGAGAATGARQGSGDGGDDRRGSEADGADVSGREDQIAAGPGAAGRTPARTAARPVAPLALASGSPQTQLHAGEREISARGAAVRTFVIPAREDIEIAGQVRSLLGVKERSV